MKNTQRKDGAEQPISDAPIEWLQRQLRRRADEVVFLSRHVFPHPARRWQPAATASGDVKTNQVIAVTVFTNEPTTCQFYITRPFTLIERTLMGGLQPDRTSFPTLGPLKLSLCVSPAEEVETDVVLRGPGEFHLMVDLAQDIASRWVESSGQWRDRPDSIPFGLVLRPLEGNEDSD